MRKTREILRLKGECKLPHRAVARSCQVGTGSVTDCLQRALRAGLSWPLPEDLGDDELDIESGRMDDMMGKYGSDSAVLDAIDAKVATLCPQQVE